MLDYSRFTVKNKGLSILDCKQHKDLMILININI